MATPAARLATRVAAQVEPTIPHPEAGPNGTLFTLKGGAPQAGSTAFGSDRRTHLVAEAATDGGVQTNSRDIVLALRGLGIYNEVKL